MSRKCSELDVKRIIALWQEGLPHSIIAERIGFTVWTIQKVIKRWHPKAK